MKQKLSALLLAVVLCLLTAACGREPALPGEYPMELIFSSGAGAWRTALTLNADGTFTGAYSDANMGETGEGYPNGTVYLCSFSGRFDALPATEPNAIPLHLAELTTEEEPGRQEIKDGILYVCAGAHGFFNYETGAQAEQFTLYAPDTPVAELGEEMLFWWPAYHQSTFPDTLGCYALWIPEAGAAFFTDPQIAN